MLGRDRRAPLPAAASSARHRRHRRAPNCVDSCYRCEDRISPRRRGRLGAGAILLGEPEGEGHYLPRSAGSVRSGSAPADIVGVSAPQRRRRQRRRRCVDSCCRYRGKISPRRGERVDRRGRAGVGPRPGAAVRQDLQDPSGLGLHWANIVGVSTLNIVDGDRDIGWTFVVVVGAGLVRAGVDVSACAVVVGWVEARAAACQDLHDRSELGVRRPRMASASALTKLRGLLLPL